MAEVHTAGRPHWAALSPVDCSLRKFPMREISGVQHQLLSSRWNAVLIEMVDKGQEEGK